MISIKKIRNVLDSNPKYNVTILKKNAGGSSIHSNIVTNLEHRVTIEFFKVKLMFYFGFQSFYYLILKSNDLKIQYVGNDKF